MNTSTYYEMGRKAFSRGVKDCPLKCRENHVYWWDGWLDARTEKALRMTRAEWGDQNQRHRPIRRETRTP